MKTTNYLASALLVALASPAMSAQLTLTPVKVTATKTETTDVTATFASEVYDANDITSSGADSLYAFLNQNTSITVMPSFGNPYSQLIDMRGYGIGNGYQNIAVTLNGRRLNNIDLSPQLLSSISLNTIDRIEITKGSGSVIYGDNATAGSIQIYTKDSVNNTIALGLGSHGQQTGSFSTGLSEQYFQLSVSADHSELDGFSDTDVDGFKDESSNNNSRIQLQVTPVDALTLSISKDHSNIDTRYPGSMTLAEFNADPSLNSGNTYTHQKFATDTVSFGVSANITDNLEISLNHSNEDKKSNFITFNSLSIYNYQSDELLVKYTFDNLKLRSGVQSFDGDRTGSTNVTTKKNIGYFVQGEYFIDDMTFSLGGRKESVDYRYAPNAGSAIADSHHLSAFDLGFNKKINDQLSVFSNYNSAYQAPDIDRFFLFGGGFNGFIQPAKSKTLNIGLNHVTANNKSKLTLFRANLNNEIFFDPISFSNTNINKSHKYGLELQNRHQFTKQFASTLNYAYTRAIVDNENEGAGAYNGKDLPGVSRHNITAALHYSPVAHSTFVLSHNYRSSAYALNDFSNSFSQKQHAYQSTNITYNFSLEKLVLSFGIDNIFDNSNGIWVRDDAIYPVNFTRSWKLGAKYNF